MLARHCSSLNVAVHTATKEEVSLYGKGPHEVSDDGGRTGEARYRGNAWVH